MASVVTMQNRDETLENIPVDLIRRGQYQPRIDFDEAALIELCNSIKSTGVIQPIVVRKMGGYYELLAGERRWRASQAAQLNTIKAIVKKNCSDELAMEISLVENLQREDLKHIEEAGALRTLKGEFGLIDEEIAGKIGKSREWVTNMLRTLELPDITKKYLNSGEIKLSIAKILCGIKDRGRVVALTKKVVRDGLTVKQLQRFVDAGQSDDKQDKKVDPNILALERGWGDRLATEVKILHNSNGSGVFQIKYYDLDQLEGILSRIK